MVQGAVMYGRIVQCRSSPPSPALVRLFLMVCHGSHMDWKNGRTSSQEKSQEILHRLEKSGKFGQFLFLFFV